MYKQYDYRVLYVLKEGGFETHTSPLEVKVGGTFHFALSKERGASESWLPYIGKYSGPLSDSRGGNQESKR